MRLVASPTSLVGNVKDGNSENSTLTLASLVVDFGANPVAIGKKIDSLTFGNLVVKGATPVARNDDGSFVCIASKVEHLHDDQVLAA